MSHYLHTRAVRPAHHMSLPVQKSINYRTPHYILVTMVRGSFTHFLIRNLLHRKSYKILEQKKCPSCYFLWTVEYISILAYKFISHLCTKPSCGNGKHECHSYQC